MFPSGCIFLASISMVDLSRLTQINSSFLTFFYKQLKYHHEYNYWLRLFSISNIITHMSGIVLITDFKNIIIDLMTYTNLIYFNQFSCCQFIGLSRYGIKSKFIFMLLDHQSAQLHVFGLSTCTKCQQNYMHCLKSRMISFPTKQFKTYANASE